MRKIWLTLSMLPLLAWAAASPRVAIVYSDWQGGNKSFFGEFDNAMKALSWKAEKIENINLPELSGRLGDFDLVIATSVANYTNTVDMAPYAQQWLEFLRGGGMLLVVDTNYTSVLTDWVGKFGAEFKVATELCSSHTKKTPESKLVTWSDHSFLRFPSDVVAPLSERTHWAHMNRIPEGWQQLATCADGDALLLLKEVGQGMIVLCSYSQMKTMDGTSAPCALLNNMVFRQQLLKNKLQLLKSDKNTAQMGISNFSFRLQGDKELLAKLKVELKEKNQAGEKTYTLTPKVGAQEADFSVALPRKQRGQTDWQLIVSAAGSAMAEATWREDLPPVIDITLKRKHLYPRMQQLEAEFVFVPEPNVNGASELRWRLDEQPWQKSPLSTLQHAQTISVAGLGVGRHLLSAEYLIAGQRQGSIEAEFFMHAQPTYEIRPDGVLLEGGKPFFPLGFYHVSWKFTPEQRRDMVLDVAAAGYNAVHVGIKGNEKTTDTYGDFLDVCAANKVRVITEFGYSANEVIKKYRPYSAVMGWNPGDEPAARGISAEEMFRRYDTFKQLDPDRLAYTVICIPAQYGRYSAGTDVLAPDPYPIPRGQVDTVFKRLNEARLEARKFDTTTWGVLQCFGGYSSWERPPTPEEFRAMTYLALMAQVQGIIYYTYADGGFFLPDNPELHAAVKALPAELKELLPLVMEGHFEMLTVDVDRVYVASWNMNNKRRIIIVNADKTETKNFSYEAREPGLPKLLYGEAPGMRREETLIKGEIKPLERIVLLE